uniref:Phosphoacetylglucosamine mutase n=1 Tax=Strongyloides venezuelensis TaxID=75913 RepID=A0A0K0FAF5_STRVS
MVKFIPYGTAGFRGPASELEKIMIRTGVVASMLARAERKVVGVMITASHNPINDNGVKIVDSNGEMINKKWEDEAIRIVYMKDGEFDDLVEKLAEEGKNNDYGKAGVLIGGDTRPSTDHFRDEMIKIIGRLNTKYKNLGNVTTPILQYSVYEVNNTFNSDLSIDVPYHQTLKSTFQAAFKLMEKNFPTRYENTLCLDGAYGVGNPKALNNVLLSNGILEIELANDKVCGILNSESGADYVKLYNKFPKCCQYDGAPNKCVSFDGDADRIIYFLSLENGNFGLIDGDKIAALFVKFIKTHLSKSGLENELTIGVVQTAYANGSSMVYLKNTANIESKIVKTGVKHLHHEAKKYDIGIYFEANGHGTVLFSNKFDREIKKNFDKNESCKYLYYFSQLINRITGDAVTDLLCVEMCLRYFDWSVSDFYNIYEDYPNKQIKVPVKNRSLFVTNEDETRLLQPEELQQFIDKKLEEVGSGRAFVRPSGTENIVRVFAEDSNMDNAEKCATDIAEEISKNYSH